MKKLINILILISIYSCNKENIEKTENLNATIEENQYWVIYSKNNFIDFAISKNQEYKIYFFYKGDLIDSIVELKLHAKQLVNKDTLIYIPNIFRKFSYFNNSLIREKIDFSLYDYYLDTSFYLKSNDLKYQRNSDSSIIITDILNNYNTYIYIKNNNIGLNGHF